MYSELLKLCAFEPQEIERERPRIDRAFAKLEIGPDDIARGEERLRKYYNIELLGMRKVMGVWLKTLIDLVLAKEGGGKVIYSALPTVPIVLGAAANASPESVFACGPEEVLAMTMGLIFDKMDPILEAAEKDILPPGWANCGGLQTRLGGMLKGYVPVPDLVFTSSFICDEVPKLDELNGMRYNFPVVYLDGIMDEMGKNWPVHTPRRVKYLVECCKEVVAKIRDVTGLDLPEKFIQEEVSPQYHRLLDSYNKLNDILRIADPFPISYNCRWPLFQITRTPVPRFFAEAPEILDILYNEVKERVDQGIGVTPKGAPRIYVCTIPQSFPEFLRIIEDLGIAIVSDSSTVVTFESVPNPFEDFWENAAAAIITRGTRYCAVGFANQIKGQIAEANADGALISYRYSCRVSGDVSVIVKDMVRKELGIPVMALELDTYSTRDYSPESMKTKLETFAEIVKSYKAAREKRR